MLHTTETWAMKADTLNRLQCIDHDMIRWICNVKAKDEVCSDSLFKELGIQDLDEVLRTSRVGWFGHVERSTGWFEPHSGRRGVSLSKTYLPTKSTGNTQEAVAPSQHY